MNIELLENLENLKIKAAKQGRERLGIFKDFYKEFFKKYSLKPNAMATKMSYYELVESLVVLANPLRVNYALKILKKYRKYFNDLYRYEDYFLPIVMQAISKDLQKYYKMSDGNLTDMFKVIKGLAEYKIDLGVNTNKIVEMWAIFDKNPGMEEELVTIFKGINLDLVIAAHTFFKAKEDYLDSTNNIAMTVKEANTVFQNIMKENEIANDKYYLSMLDKEFQKISKNVLAKIRKDERTNERLEALIRALDIPGEIRDIDKIMELVPNKEIKNQVVNCIIKHNQRYYEELFAKFVLAQEMNYDNLKRLFGKYNLNYDMMMEENREQLMRFKYKEIKEILEILKSLNLNIQINLIPFINLKKLKVIEELIKNATISREFGKKCLDLMKENDGVLEIILNNIRILSDKGINIRNYHNSLDILLSDKIATNIEILDKYLISINRNTTDINFLSSNDLEDKISLLLELGLFYEMDSWDILNETRENIYKIIIAVLIKVNVEDLREVKGLVHQIYHDFIPDDIINLLRVNSNNKIELPKELEKYRINNYLLSINGVNVAINRFLNNLGKMRSRTNKDIFYAIIYDSFYDVEEIKQLQLVLVPEVNSLYSLVRK